MMRYRFGRKMTFRRRALRDDRVRVLSQEEAAHPAGVLAIASAVEAQGAAEGQHIADEDERGGQPTAERDGWLPPRYGDVCRARRARGAGRGRERGLTARARAGIEQGEAHRRDEAVRRRRRDDEHGGGQPEEDPRGYADRADHERAAEHAARAEIELGQPEQHLRSRR
jgi:hypothetical protein